MELKSATNGVVEGYAAFNLQPYGWKGVIEGNMYCKDFRETAKEALRDAKELYKSEK